MDDLISREAAIDALILLQDHSDMSEDWHKGVSASLSCLFRVPFVERKKERKKGRWEWAALSSFNEQLKLPSCSLCHCVFNSRYNYCPNCGAEMEGE